MRKKIFTWLGKEFIELSGEAKPAASAAVEARDLFRRFDEELRSHGLSLDHTVRSRLWGRDRESRDGIQPALPEPLDHEPDRRAVQDRVGREPVVPRHGLGDRVVAAPALAGGDGLGL